MLNLVSFFGEILADITGKPLMACSAFIRLALKDAGKEVKGTIITHKELQEVFKGPLKERLAALQVGDVQEIIGLMLLERSSKTLQKRLLSTFLLGKMGLHMCIGDRRILIDLALFLLMRL